MKTEMSSFDIMAMVSELKGEMRVKKVYQPSPSKLRIQLRFIEEGAANLLVEVGKTMYLSDYVAPSPKSPSNFAMTLRKYLSNAWVKGIEQVGFDRIVELIADVKEGTFKIVFELFGEGNTILVDGEGRIKALMKQRRFKHRALVGKVVYEYPPQRSNPFELSAVEIVEIVKSFKSLVKALAVPLGLGGLYSEEVCARAGIKKNVSELTKDEAETIVRTLKELREEALSPAPFIVYENDEPVDVVPMKLVVYEDKKTKSFSSFNNALDAFFTEREVERVEEKVENTYKEGLTSINIRLKEQATAIGRFNKDSKEFRLVGDAIYNNFDTVQSIIDEFVKARKSLSADEIKEKIKSIDYIKEYLPKENAIVISMAELVFRLNLSLSAPENAAHYYSRSKKAKVKIKGARNAAEKTKGQIKQYLREGVDAARAQEGVPVKKEVKKRRWFESFRWFTSSDGFLVLGGRDASSNEVVVKKHMEKDDIFIHAEIHGAPAVVLKSERKKIPDTTINEACQFAASTSVAWKSGAAFLDVYWVRPDQVSKTPRSGEYVSKGAFIITGKRNYIRSKVLLSVGVKMNGNATVICGPPDAVSKNCEYHLTIAPGRLKSKEVAVKIKELILRKAKEEHRGAITKLNIDEIQRLLPTGGQSIVGKYT